MKAWQAVAIDNGNNFLENLSISDEREQELIELISNKETESKVELLEYITGECTNINEALYAAYLMAAMGSKCFNCPLKELLEGGAPIGRIELKIKRRDYEED